MCLALGRDPDAAGLLSRKADFATPDVSFMEALGAMKPVRTRSRQLRSAIESELNEVQRDRDSSKARELHAALAEARVKLGEYLNDVVESRFRNALRQLSQQARIIPLAAAAIERCLRDPIVAGQADNLILHSILHDAENNPARFKAFLSENTRDFHTPTVLEALKRAGATYLSKPTDAVQWLEAKAKGPPPASSSDPGEPPTPRPASS
jgi:hypothetical protein